MSLVTVPDLKQFAGVDYNTHDSILQMILSGAEDFLASYMDARFYQKEFVEYLGGGFKQLWVANKPLISVSEVLDTLADEVVDVTLYEIDDRSVIVIDDGYWGEGNRRYKVTSSAGWTVNTVPSSVKLACLMLAARAYESRTGKSSLGSSGFSFNYQDLLKSDIIELIQPYSFARVLG